MKSSEFYDEWRSLEKSLSPIHIGQSWNTIIPKLSTRALRFAPRHFSDLNFLLLCKQELLKRETPLERALRKGTNNFKE